MTQESRDVTHSKGEHVQKAGLIADYTDCPSVQRWLSQLTRPSGLSRCITLKFQCGRVYSSLSVHELYRCNRLVRSVVAGMWPCVLVMCVSESVIKLLVKSFTQCVFNLKYLLVVAINSNT